MRSIFLLDGELLSGNSDYFTFNSRSYRYGDGFFETLKYHQGRIQHSFLHSERIHKSLVLLQMPTPVIEFNQLESRIQKAIQNEGWSCARIRISYIREGKGSYWIEDENTRVLVEIKELPNSDNQYALNENGLTIGNYKELTKNSNFISTLKTTSSMLYVLAAKYAKQQNWDEAIIFNDNERICEGISSNIFFVMGDFIVTPPISEYCVDGIMRKIVLELAREYGYNVVERPVTEIELGGCTEIFLTNTVKGIQWVKNYNGKVLQSDIARVLLSKLSPKETLF